MAINANITSGSSFGYSVPKMEFIMDSVTDVANLPTQNDARGICKCATGSVAYPADLSAIYILSPSGVWTENS